MTSLLPRAIVLSFAVCIGVTARAGADGIRLRADAGLGGVVRPGRWVPVRIFVENDAPAWRGALVVRWGNAAVRRAVVLGDRSRNTYELYARTTDVRGAVAIDLEKTNGDVEAHVDTAVSVASNDVHVAICVSAEAIAAPAAGCSATVVPAALPRSIRGYDAADEIVWRAAARGELDHAQRAAFDAWRGERAFEDAGLLAQVPRPTPTATDPVLPRALRPAAIILSLYTALLGALAVVRPLRTGRPLAACGAIVVASAAAMSASGRPPGFGNSQSPLVAHATTVLQIGETTSTLTVRGTVGFPAGGQWALTALVPDGTFNWEDQPGATLDAGGYPVMSGSFPLAATREFALEGVSDFAPLRIERHDDMVRVANASERSLRDCRFPAGFSPALVPELRSGMSIEATDLGSSEDRLFTCTLDALPFELMVQDRAARVEGATVVSAFVPARELHGAPR